MARLLTCGWETGDLNEAGVTSINAGTIALVTSSPSPRTGTYCLKCSLPSTWSGDCAKKIFNLGAALTTICGRFAWYPYHSPPESSLYVMRLLDSAGTPQCGLAVTAPSTYTLVAYRGSTSNVLATASRAALPTQWNIVQFKVTISDAAGRFEVWLNDVKVIDFTGDTENTSNTNVSFVELGLIRIVNSSGSNITYYAFDDIALNDTTGAYENDVPDDAAVLLLTPNGVGTTTQLTPSAGDNYACVDEIPPSTSDYVESDTADQQDTYVMQDLSAQYNQIALVQPIFYAGLAASGTGALRGVVRSGGTDYADTADKPLSTTAAFVRGDVHYVDPADNATWTPAKVNALEVGPRVK